MSNKSELKKIRKLNKPHKNEEKTKDNTNGNIIDLINVSKKYKNGSEVFNALENINISISKGSFTVIVGRSGSGKSTLLNIMSGLIRPTEGNAIVDGSNLISYKNSELTKFRSLNCGFIFQQYGLLSTLTIEENIYTGLNLKLHNTKKEKQDNKLKNKHKKEKDKNRDNSNEELYNFPKMYDIMKKIGIYDLKKKYPSQLSGGQQQRASIARAIIKEPKILFGDEPTGAVDSAMTYNIINLLKSVNSNGTTVILITHDPRLTSVADHVIEIENGKIIKDYKQKPIENYKDLFI